MENKEAEVAYDIIKEGKNYFLVKVEYNLEDNTGKVVSKEMISDNDSVAIFRLNKIIVNKIYGIKE